MFERLGMFWWKTLQKTFDSFMAGNMENTLVIEKTGKSCF